jgi:hypothetical protein
LHVSNLPAVAVLRTFFATGIVSCRAVLPLLALIATLLLPLARPVHEAIERSAHVLIDHGYAHDPETPPAPHEHDSDHCSLCATLGSLKHLSAASVFLYALTFERTPVFIVPSYPAPSTAEPALALAVPRGPPRCV